MSEKKVESDLSSILVISPSIDEEEYSTNEGSPLSLQAENQILKRQCEALKLRLENLAKTKSTCAPQNSIASLGCENSDPKDEFVDVNCLVIFEKIEEHLKEANRIFTESSKYKEVFVYLVKNFWSLTAYMYSDVNLHHAKQLRDELLKKIEEIDLINTTNAIASSSNNQIITDPSVSSISPCTSSFLKNETELFSSMNFDIALLQNCKTTTDSLQARLVEQNNMLKSFLKDMEENNFENEKSVKIEKLKIKLANESNIKFETLKEHQNNVDKSIKTEKSESNEENFSPGSSPSSFFMNKFDRLLKNSQKSNDIFTLDNEETTQTITESQKQTEILSSTSTENPPQSPIESGQNSENTNPVNSSINPTPQPPETINQRHDDSLYLYCVNDGDYIGVNNTLELDPSGDAAAANNQQPEHAHPKIQRSNVENYVQFEDLNHNLGYKCLKCKNVADSTLITYEAYIEHLIACNPVENKVCNICMRIFDKKISSIEIEQHINNHFSE